MSPRSLVVELHMVYHLAWGGGNHDKSEVGKKEGAMRANNWEMGYGLKSQEKK